MSDSIEVKVLNRSCGAGDVYAQNHLTDNPKAAIVSCEGACLKGEIARRAANLIAQELAPERTARICHGGAFMLNQGGMRELVEVAKQVIIVEGCPMGCGTRIARAAFPERDFDVVVANALYKGNDALFGTNELPNEEIQRLAKVVAEQIVADKLQDEPSESSGCDPKAMMAGMMANMGGEDCDPAALCKKMTKTTQAERAGTCCEPNEGCC